MREDDNEDTVYGNIWILLEVHYGDQGILEMATHTR